MKITKTLKKRGLYFQDDKWEKRNIYRITISNKDKKCSFGFRDSIVNTEKGEYPSDYDILACVKSDYNLTKEYYPTYEDFASEFGYGIDSIKGNRIYKSCLSQAERLQRVFTPEEIEAMPD